MQLNRRVFAGVFIAATALGCGAPVAAGAAPSRPSAVVPGTPGVVNDLAVKARNQNAKAKWKAPVVGGTVNHYEARLLTSDGALLVEHETKKLSDKLVLPKAAELHPGTASTYIVHVVAVGNDGSESPVVWSYVSLRYKVKL